MFWAWVFYILSSVYLAHDDELHLFNELRAPSSLLKTCITLCKSKCLYTKILKFKPKYANEWVFMTPSHILHWWVATCPFGREKKPQKKLYLTINCSWTYKQCVRMVDPSPWSSDTKKPAHRLQPAPTQLDSTLAKQSWLNHVVKAGLKWNGATVWDTIGAKKGATALEWCIYCSCSFGTKQPLVFSMTIHSIRPGLIQR